MNKTLAAVAAAVATVLNAGCATAPGGPETQPVCVRVDPVYSEAINATVSGHGCQDMPNRLAVEFRRRGCPQELANNIEARLRGTDPGAVPKACSIASGNNLNPVVSFQFQVEGPEHKVDCSYLGTLEDLSVGKGVRCQLPSSVNWKEHERRLEDLSTLAL
jgi:hypothetical protein